MAEFTLTKSLKPILMRLKIPLMILLHQPRPDEEETGEAWLSVYKSWDGGNHWISTLLDGYPQQNNISSPLNGFQAAADPVVRAANNGLFYYAGIVHNRGTNPASGVFIARFIDRNNTEFGDPIPVPKGRRLIFA